MSWIFGLFCLTLHIVVTGVSVVIWKYVAKGVVEIAAAAVVSVNASFCACNELAKAVRKIHPSTSSRNRLSCERLEVLGLVGGRRRLSSKNRRVHRCLLLVCDV